MTYSDKLRDPRWQKKRLEIMQRDNFTCQQCERGDSMLAVHHAYYVKGREPWNYPNFALQTLCDDCHKVAQAIVADEFSSSEIVMDLLCGGSTDVRELYDAVDNLRCDCELPGPALLATVVSLLNAERVQRLGLDGKESLISEEPCAGEHRVNNATSGGQD